MYSVAETIERLPMDYVFVPTIGGRGQRHPHGLVGNLFRIKTPESVRVGYCFMAGRLKPNDLWLCTAHSGDCFQTYIYVEECANYLIGKPVLNFGSYGIGDAELVEIPDGAFNVLQSGGHVEWGRKKDE